MILRIILLSFFVFVGISNFATGAELYLRGNSLFSVFLGRNNVMLFSIRNIEAGAEAGGEYFFAKGVLDINPFTYQLFSDVVEQENSIMESYFKANTGAPPESTLLPNTLVRVKEAFVSTRGLPFVRFMLGRFYGRIGDANSKTFFQRWFVERPLTIRKFFGTDGLLDEGFELSIFPPLPWTLEIVGQIFDGSEKSWGTIGSFELVYLISLRNGFGDERRSGGFGLFWATGKNRSSERLILTEKLPQVASDNFTDFFGGDVYFNFSPFLSINLGYILRRLQGPGTLDVDGGIFSEFVIAPVSFFAVGIRPEIFGLPSATFFGEGGSETRPQMLELSISATFIPQDNVKIRLQWTGNFSEKALPQNIIYLQTMFSL